ncbi:MAG: InlB B-repeat-containing protein [Chitinispirillales bacterium]|nr:InlB B-repeat-containing protein [Chitinispirillales bacterium]
MRKTILYIAMAVAVAAIIAIGVAGCNDGGANAGRVSEELNAFLNKFDRLEPPPDTSSGNITYKLITNASPPEGGNVSRNPDKAVYDFGEAVTVTAAPAKDYEFTGWSGMASGTANTVTVTMDGNKAVTAGFGKKGATRFTVYFNSNGGGNAPAQIPADSGKGITLPGQQAMEKEGYRFEGWSKNSDGTGTAYPANSNYAVTGNVTLYAVWAQITYYTLTVKTSPANGGGTVSRNPNKDFYASGETVTVMAAPANGYTFTSWSGASTSTSASVTITMTENKTLTANFQQQSVTPAGYTLTASASPTAGGSVTRNPNATSYDAGASVSVTATAASGYTFTGWSGASTSTSSPVTITMDGNKTLTANFAQTYTLTASASPSGGGSVSPSSGTYTSGTSVSVTATAASGYTFTGWSGASTSTSSPVTITMNGDKTLTANFAQQSVGGGSGTFTDSRDSKLYKYVTIGGKKWTAENLSYATASGSYSGNDGQYGMYYTWSAAMSGSTSSAANPSGVRGVCPDGWHLPSNAEWGDLVTAVGGNPGAGTKLKSTRGWIDNGNGTDNFGFSALPGGYRGTDGYFRSAGFVGRWWTATEDDADYAYFRSMSYVSDDVNYYGGGADRSLNGKGCGFSVRCVGD